MVRLDTASLINTNSQMKMGRFSSDISEEIFPFISDLFEGVRTGFRIAVLFVHYLEGALYAHLHGARGGCAGSAGTLHMK